MEKYGIVYPVAKLIFRPQVFMAGLLATVFLFCAENSISFCNVALADCGESFSPSSDDGDWGMSGEMQPLQQKEMVFTIFRPIPFSQTWGVCFAGRQQQSKASPWFSPLHLLIPDCCHSSHFKQSFYCNASTHCCAVRPHALFCRYLN